MTFIVLYQYRDSANLNSNIDGSKEFELMCEDYYTDVASSGQHNLYGVYDDWNGINDMKNRKLPKLPQNTSDTKLSKTEQSVNWNLHRNGCSSDRNSDIYTNMDGSDSKLKDYETDDCKSESESYTYEELENFQ